MESQTAVTAYLNCGHLLMFVLKLRNSNRLSDQEAFLSLRRLSLSVGVHACVTMVTASMQIACLSCFVPEQ